MSQRFLIYPLLIIIALRLAPMVRTGARWYAVQILQLIPVLLACVGGFFIQQGTWWAGAAWALYFIVGVVPELLAREAGRQVAMARWNGAALAMQLAGWLTWGNLGRLYRLYAEVLRAMQRGETEAALLMLNYVVADPMPVGLCGTVRLWALSMLCAQRDWEQAVLYYDSVPEWGTLAASTHARLLVARAMAETGEIERALRSLQMVALSPRTIGPMETQLWMTRVVVAALAGDAPELEALLPQHRLRSAPQFPAYWCGRCALARGQRVEAVQQLTRAFSLTNPRNKLWREAISKYLGQTDAMERVSPAAEQPQYAWGQEALRAAEKQTASWRALMNLSAPAALTVWLLAFLSVVFVFDLYVCPLIWNKPLQVWAANTPDALKSREWWRPVTAMFLHANLLHLLMNGFGIWMFGSSAERYYGRVRYVIIFLVAGTMGNLLSLTRSDFDMAVGASGSLFGLVGAFAVAVYRLDVPVLASARSGLMWMLALMVCADLTIGWLEPQVDNLAHVGGFVTGVVLTLLMPSCHKENHATDS